MKGLIILLAVAFDSAFVGKYVYPPIKPGTYQCAGCSQPLFHSDEQYDAGAGFPCFKQPIDAKHIYFEKDENPWVKRYGILCRKCDGHLGHLFRDGPPPKYFRYCLNSSALQFVKEKIDFKSK